MCVILTISNRCVYFGYMKTVLNVKTDKKLKESAQKVSKEMGVPLSILVNNYLRKLIEEKGVYIAASYKREVPKPHVAKRWAKIDKDIKAGRNLSPGFTSIQEMDKYLDSLK